MLILSRSQVPTPVTSVAHCTGVITSQVGGWLTAKNSEPLTLLPWRIGSVSMESSWPFLTHTYIGGSRTLLERYYRILPCHYPNSGMERHSILWCMGLIPLLDFIIPQQSLHILYTGVSSIPRLFIFFAAPMFKRYPSECFIEWISNSLLVTITGDSADCAVYMYICWFNFDALVHRNAYKPTKDR